MAFALSDMELTSPAFEPGGRIPSEHTGEGENTSPPFEWRGAPDGTRSFALVCHDPDAPMVSAGSYGFAHWSLYNIPASVTSLMAGTPDYSSSGYGDGGYGGPMPPPGHGTHHYFFWLFALSAEPDLDDGLSFAELLEQIEPHTLGMNRLVGTYERS